MGWIENKVRRRAWDVVQGHYKKHPNTKLTYSEVVNEIIEMEIEQAVERLQKRYRDLEVPR